MVKPMTQTPQTHKIEIKLFYRTPSLAHDEPCPYILWVSRHPPLQAQIRELERKLGKIHVVKMSGVIPNAEYVADFIKMIDRKRYPEIYVVPVLPLSFVARLVELSKRQNFTVLMAKMEAIAQTTPEEAKKLVDEASDRRTATTYADGSVKVHEFKGFEKIVKVQIVTEPW